MYALSTFTLDTFRALRFPLSYTIIVSHKFEFVVSYFSLNSKTFLIFFFSSSSTKLSLSEILLNVHVYLGFLTFLFL